MGQGALALAGLIVGLGLGWAASRAGVSRSGLPAAAASVAGELWLTVLLSVVLPLVVLNAITAIARPQGRVLGPALAVRLLLLAAALLAASGLVAVLAAPPLLAVLGANAASVPDSPGAPFPTSDAPESGEGSARPSRAGQVADIVGRYRALAGRAVLPVLVLGLVTGVGLRRVRERRRGEIVARLERAANRLLAGLRRVLSLTPAAVLAFAFVGVLRGGALTAGSLLGYVVAACAVLMLCTVLLYPVAVLLGRVGLSDFARALFPAQVVALSTRSSIAALPALVASARDELRLAPELAGTVLSLCTALLKLSAVAAKTTGVIYLAGLYGRPLGPAELAAFIASVMLLSSTTVGVPLGGAAFTTMPAFAAAGIPLDGVVLLASVEAVPDLFKTVLNVTANLTVAVAAAPGRHPRADGPDDAG
ncbi:MAG: dicarboxylate/amino acid:cation symporter [Gemmatimonadales bacterium]|nr:dicarboxylate/amino acid:cation symporter [Gemmatimonadales bacterium]